MSHLYREWDTLLSLLSLRSDNGFRGENLNEYKGQTDIFYSSPIAYIQSRFPDTVDLSFPPSPYPSTIPGTKTSDSQPWQHEWPQNIVLFGSLLQEQGVRELLIQKGYRQVWGEDGSWEEDPRRRGGVQVWRYTDSLVL